MPADKLITDRTISTGRLYTSIKSKNWLLDRGIATVGTLQQGRSGIPSELFDNQNREIFSATCHFEMEKSICLTSYTVETKSKEKKMLCYRPPDHSMAKQLVMLRKAPNNQVHNLAKSLALPYVQRRSLNGQESSVQLKIKMFLGTTLLVEEPVPNVERRFTGTGQRRRCQLHMANRHTSL